MFIGILIFPPIGAICLLSRELIQRIHVFLIFVCRLGHCVLFNRCDGQGHSMLIEEERAQRIFRNTRGWAPSYTVTSGLCRSLNCGDFHLHRPSHHLRTYHTVLPQDIGLQSFPLAKIPVPCLLSLPFLPLEEFVLQLQQWCWVHPSSLITIS